MAQKRGEVAAELAVQRAHLVHRAEGSVSIAQRIFQFLVALEHHVELAVIIEIGKYTVIVTGSGRLQRLFQSEMTGAIIDPGVKRFDGAAAFAAKLVIGQEEVWRRVSINITDRTVDVSATVG